VGKEPTPIQQYRIGVLQGMGFAADFCDSFDDFKTLLDPYGR
jgi:hypothetical protein